MPAGLVRSCRPDEQHRGLDMTDTAALRALLIVIEQYFEMMFDSDVARFDHVFAPTAQLHGLRDEELRILTAADYRDLLATNPSPKSKGAPRQQEILLVDFASPSQAVVKVRVRIEAIVYVDHLCFHLIDGKWLVTAKSFHVEHRFEGTTV
ncbi:nuclear transport factor 2 family protein [Bradyrhizobium sp. STM 3557]|uniref:nuclear transport factor 2 family protein n=1 Tax=Bradyrhizobium sp. STM 3557 TaxID=578920 RepID=UPI003890FC51